MSARARSGSPPGPGDAPWPALRAVAALGAVASLVVTTILMLSDRAPGILRGLSRRVDAGDGRAARIASDARLPESDFEIHVVAWAAVTLLAALAAWSWRSFLATGTVVLAWSTVVELAQEHLTVTRTTQVDDMAANALGVALGLGVAAAVHGVVRVVVALSRDRRRLRSPPPGAPSRR